MREVRQVREEKGGEGRRREEKWREVKGREGGKEGRSVCVCQVQLCLSVLSLAHTCFLADRGTLTCHIRLRSAQHAPSLRE